jgi:hypothetical protein
MANRIGVIGSPSSMKCRWDSWDFDKDIGTLDGVEYMFISPSHHPHRYSGVHFRAIIINEQPIIDDDFLGREPINPLPYYNSLIRRAS